MLARCALRSSALLTLCAALACASAHTKPEASAATAPLFGTMRVLAPSDEPRLFLSPGREAPVFGFVSRPVLVELNGAVEAGRVPVRIDGAIRVKALVPEQALRVRVRRRGRVRGTPVYVGPGDLVRVLGRAGEPSRVQVTAAPVLHGRELRVYEGSYPEAGLGVEPPDAAAEAPTAGAAYVLEAGQALHLSDEPEGAVVTRVPPQATPTEVRVISEQDGWRAVRIGEGPYLIGYTNERLSPLSEQSAALVSTKASPPAANADLPEQLEKERGVLKGVAAGTQVRFAGRVVAVFKRPGFARVLGTRQGELVDVFAAADDTLSVRGLVPASALSDLHEQPPAFDGEPDGKAQ